MKTNLFNLFLYKFFSRTTLSKIFIIFAFSFLSRMFINHYFEINVFTEFMHPISIAYYSILSTFIVFINELFSFFNISIIPNFTGIWSYFIRFKFEYLKPSFLRNLIRDYLNTSDNKITMNQNVTTINDKVEEAISDSTHLLKDKDDKGKGKATYTNESKGESNSSRYRERGYSSQELHQTSTLDKIRCRIHWICIDKYKGDYNNYKAYKLDWNNDSRLYNKIKVKFTNEYNEKIHEIKVFKGTIKWILNRRNPNQ